MANKRVVVMCCAALMLSHHPSAQSMSGRQVAGGSGPRFEVVTVKRNMSGATTSGGVRIQSGGQVTATNVTLRELVAYAYQRHPFDVREVTGGPEWMNAERFDVVARAPGEHAFAADGSMPQTWAMMRALLAERFNLKAHEEDRERQIYALMTMSADAALGPKLHRTDADCGAAMMGPRPPMGPAGPPCSMKTPPGRLFANTIGMPTLATLLSRYVDRIVVDRTGLSGRFDVALEASEIKPPSNYKPGPSDAALPPPSASSPSIFVAVRDQLGLKLEPQTGSIAVVVVDHADRPNAN
jgi:uncharacterized protein (TIGR03435 family)